MKDWYKSFSFGGQHEGNLCKSCAIKEKDKSIAPHLLYNPVIRDMLPSDWCPQCGKSYLISPEKKKQPDAKIVESLENLKEELYKDNSDNPAVSMIFWKINSCLFAEYPHK